MDFITNGIIKAIQLLLSGNPETYSAVYATIKVSSCSIFTSILLGVPLGFFLGFYDFKGKRALRLIVDTLLSIPTVFIGLLVYSFISSRGPLGDLGLLFTLSGIGIGQTILALPIVIALSATAVESMDEGLSTTLISLGANRFRLLTGCLYEIRFSLIAASVTAYGRVLTEVGISMMVGGNVKWYTRTITTAIALETGKGMFATGIALGIVLLLIAFVVNFSISFFGKK